MTTSLPTLPPGWDPPAESSCLQIDDYWQWDFGDSNNRPTVFGGPSQTLSCFPSTGAPTGTYAGITCPPHYSDACPALGEDGIVTCCPTAYSFTCAPEPRSTGPASLFKCQTRYTENGGFLTASKINMRGNSPPESTTLSQKSGGHLVAPGLVYKTLVIVSTATATSSELSSNTATATPSDRSSSDSSSGGLSTTAKAGVGVSVAVGGLLVVAIACWLIWRRRKSAHQPQADPHVHTQYAHTPTINDEAKTTGVDTIHWPPSAPTRLYPVVSGPHEMHDTPSRGAELPG